jgi:hypothetical protein
MNAYLVKDKAEAKALALSLIDKKKQISFGGSETLRDIGLLDELRNNSRYKLIDRDLLNTNQFMKHRVMKDEGTRGIYLSGTNALTEDGRIVNMDGWGNRVNSIQYGPDKVIIVIGKNKIVKDLDAAITRIAEVASPPNTKRLKLKTPCVKTGKCEDCRSPERICNILSIILFQREKDRIHVIIVDEDLGY